MDATVKGDGERIAHLQGQTQTLNALKNRIVMIMWRKAELSELDAAELSRTSGNSLYSIMKWRYLEDISSILIRKYDLPNITHHGRTIVELEADFNQTLSEPFSLKWVWQDTSEVNRKLEQYGYPIFARGFGKATQKKAEFTECLKNQLPVAMSLDGLDGTLFLLEMLFHFTIQHQH